MAKVKRTPVGLHRDVDSKWGPKRTLGYPRMGISNKEGNMNTSS